MPHTVSLSLLDGVYWGEVWFNEFPFHLTSFSFSIICSKTFPNCPLSSWLINFDSYFTWTANYSWMSSLWYDLIHNSAVLVNYVHYSFSLRGQSAFAWHSCINTVEPAKCARLAVWTCCQWSLEKERIGFKNMNWTDLMVLLDHVNVVHCFSTHKCSIDLQWVLGTLYLSRDDNSPWQENSSCGVHTVCWCKYLYICMNSVL